MPDGTDYIFASSIFGHQTGVFCIYNVPHQKDNFQLHDAAVIDTSLLLHISNEMYMYCLLVRTHKSCTESSVAGDMDVYTSGTL